MDRYYSTSTDGHDQGRSSWLRSFEMDKTGEKMTIIIEVADLNDREAVIDLLDDRLRIGYLRRRDEKVVGVASEEFMIPDLKGARLIGHETSGDTIFISIVKNACHSKKKQNHRNHKKVEQISSIQSDLNHKEQWKH